MVDEKENKSEIPKFMEELENGQWKVIGKHGTYILEEKGGKVVESCEKLSEKTGIPYENLLVTRSSVEPKLSDNDFGELKGSDYFRLKAAITYVYGLNDFL